MYIDRQSYTCSSSARSKRWLWEKYHQEKPPPHEFATILQQELARKSPIRRSKLWAGRRRPSQLHCCSGSDSEVPVTSRRDHMYHVRTVTSRLRVYVSDLIFSRPRSEGWPHHGRTFSIYLCPLSFWLTLPRRVLSTSWCCAPMRVYYRSQKDTGFLRNNRGTVVNSIMK